MVSNLGNKLKKDKDGQRHQGLLQLLYQIRYTLLHTGSNYLEWVLQDLKTAISNNDLAMVDKLTSTLACELVNRGWSPQSLHGSVRIFVSTDNSFENKWENFVEQVASGKKEWICLYRLKSKDQSFEFLEKAGLRIKSGHEIHDEYGDAGVVDRISTSSMYIIKIVSAYDLASAVAISNEQIRQSLDILHFCRYAIPEIDETIVVIFPDNIKSITYKIVDPWISSGTHEGAFLQGPFEDLMDHIKTIVSSAHCARYVYRLVRNFIEDAKRCGIQLELPNGLISDMPRRWR